MWTQVADVEFHHAGRPRSVEILSNTGVAVEQYTLRECSMERRVRGPVCATKCIDLSAQHLHGKAALQHGQNIQPVGAWRG